MLKQFDLFRFPLFTKTHCNQNLPTRDGGPQACLWQQAMPRRNSSIRHNSSCGGPQAEIVDETDEYIDNTHGNDARCHTVRTLAQMLPQLHICLVGTPMQVLQPCAAARPRPAVPVDLPWQRQPFARPSTTRSASRTEKRSSARCV